MQRMLSDHDAKEGSGLVSMYGLYAADLIHGTEIVYSEQEKLSIYQQRFLCDLWFPLRKKWDNFSRGTEFAMREKQYVRVDEHGVIRVGTTRVMLDALVAGFEQGHSPETIQQQFPALSLEEVYGAITYYLSHRDDVQAYLQRQEALWKALRAEAEAQASPVVKRLRALRGADVSDAS